MMEGIKIGGRDRDRTCDLMLAKHALSQLSYTPTFVTTSILLYLARFENPDCAHVSAQRFQQLYLRIPSAFFGTRPTSSFAIPKLSAINEAGFPASHFEIEISSNVGLLNNAKNFVGSLPICST